MNPEITKFLCPNCKKQYEAPIKVIGVIAHMICSNCNYPFNVNLNKSLHFREFCSKIARKPTRNRDYYTKPERKVKQILDSLGLIEGHDYIHNVRFKAGKRTYYWVDFLLPHKSIVIEVSPSIWHRYFPRNDKERKVFFRDVMGYEYFVLKEKLYNKSKLLKQVLKKICEIE